MNGSSPRSAFLRFSQQVHPIFTVAVSIPSMFTQPTAPEFLKQLRRWAGHCSLNAAPSFIIAVAWMELRSFHGIAAMVCAILTFIVGYSVLTTVMRPLSESTHPLGRALRIGLIVRGWISGFSCLGAVLPWFLLFTPDFWCGFLAMNSVGWIYENVFHLPFDVTVGRVNVGFFAIYLTTLFEGLILSALLFFFCFTALIIMTTLLRRRMIPNHWLMPPQ